MKRFLPLIAVLVMLCSTFFGNSILNVMAKEQEGPEVYRYFKSVEIQEGDSLWSIAKDFNTHDQMPIQSYIKELKNMNGLNQDTIHKGQHLTIMYFSEEHFE